jgi:hypothetical protein
MSNMHSKTLHKTNSSFYSQHNVAIVVNFENLSLCTVPVLTVGLGLDTGDVPVLKRKLLSLFQFLFCHAQRNVISNLFLMSNIHSKTLHNPESAFYS